MSQTASLIRYSARVALFVGLLFLCQFVGRGIVFEPAKTEAVQLARSAVKAQADILIFGDSIMEVTRGGNGGGRSLGAMLVKGLPEKKVFVLSYPAYASQVFSGYSYYFKQARYQPSMVVVPINLRSFSSAFDMRPGWQYEREIADLRFAHSRLLSAFELPLLIFKGINLESTSQETWLSQKVFDGDKVVGIAKDFYDEGIRPEEDSIIKKQFLWFYMGKLKADHRKFKALKEIVSYYVSSRTKILFYVTPVDCVTGERLLGPRFKSQVAENVSLLADMARDTGSEFLDLSNSLGADGFLWPTEPEVSEHLSHQGRIQVVKQVVPYLRRATADRALTSTDHP